MFLLIRIFKRAYFLYPFFFTFHYVSINTFGAGTAAEQHTPLHSTMFLLILTTEAEDINGILPLHSTMFLLIRAEPVHSGRQTELYIPLCFY